MKLAMCGLGKMGMNLVFNLLDNGHEVIAYDINSELVNEAKDKGASAAYTIEEIMNSFEDEQRIIWMMVPSGDITEELLENITPFLNKEDIVLDGGNAHYKDSMRRHESLKEKGYHYVDVGTSGGIEGARYGACTMVGGDKEVVSKIEQVFYDVSTEKGYLYTGKSGSGHFVKMIHNGIEYGMMQAIGEGFDILEKSDFDLDYKEVARVWNHGSVIRSWLMELLENAFSKDEKLDAIQGIVHASGEGQWTVETAMELETATPVIALSLMMRNRSLESDTFSGKVVASLRNEFGGHSIVSKD